MPDLHTQAIATPATCDVAVIGAGISGLAVADHLTRAGAAVSVIEARGRVGGRLFGMKDNTALDLGATWFWEGERRTQDLVDRLRVGSFPQHLRGDTVVEDLNGVIRHRGNLVDMPAHRYAGGATSLADGLARTLPAESLHLGHAVDAVTIDGTSPKFDLEVSSSGRTWRARHVVLALPPALAVATIELPKLLPTQLCRTAAATPTWMAETVKVVAQYDEPFWRLEGLAGAGISRLGPLQEIHDMSGPDGEPAALFGFAHSSRLDPEPQVAILEQLVRMFGERAGRPARLAIQDWSREPWTARRAATASSDSMFGHPDLRRPAMAGRLHWSSTETAMTFPGHVEGALEAAERTADYICADLGIRRAT
ncbi:FAD-dependent oxidoreductase [Nocardioides sp. YIM 152315]|uniref:flavin monoamine oxidase family protein n=1 Tax=Nocardioides sp. YIM 152315 TaxID=3031760 RepID=UPI0023DAF925|nr:FAD-dependent oxidoreductase [Nocardioides sp. YIM 152315]MDF1605860.1 FAD-dependent oxidoreductase [Nocardioides sp. YIM 152315]